MKNPKPTGNIRNKIVVLGAAHSLNHSLFLIAPQLLTLIMLDLHVDILTIGAVTFAASLIYGTGALLGGPLADRFGEIETLTISLGMSGLFTLTMLMAGATQNIVIFTLALTSMAAWASLYHPISNSLISKAFRGRMAESMGLHGAAGTLGQVLAPLIAFSIGTIFGWQYAFIAFGTAAVIVALAIRETFPKNVRHKNRQGSIIGAFKLRELWLLLIMNVMIGFFMKGVELYLPTYLAQEKNITGVLPSLSYTLILAAGVPGQWLGGRLSQRSGPKKMLMFAMAGVVLGFGALVFTPFELFGVILFVVLYGICFYGHQPAMNALTGLLSPENQRGAVFGVFFFTNFGIGSLSQLAAGFLADKYGFASAFTLLTIFAAAALALSFKLPNRTEKKAPLELD
jgi:MFS family permease